MRYRKSVRNNNNTARARAQYTLGRYRRVFIIIKRLNENPRPRRAA